MIKGEILLRILLTLILLLSPIIFLIKNYNSLIYLRINKFKQYLNFLQDKSNTLLTSIKEKIPEEKSVQEPSVATKEKKVPELAKEIIDKKPQKEVKKKEIREKKVKKTQEQLILDQKQKEKLQKKLQEIKMSAITNKERGKIDEYEKKLIEGLALNPDYTEFQEKLSDLYFEQGNFVKAQSILKKLVNQAPSNHKAIWQIGQIYLHQKDLDTAKILIEKAISVKNDNPKYIASLVDIQYSQGLVPEAIKSMEKILKLRPTKIEYLLGIADLHEQNSEPSKAVMYYSKIIELDPLQEDAKLALQRLKS